MRVVIFLSVVFLVLASIHWYLYARLIRACIVPPLLRRIVKGWFVLVPLTFPAPFLLAGLPSPWPGRVVAYPYFTWFGLMFFLLSLLVFTDLLRLIVRVFGGLPSDPERALTVRRATAALVVLVAVSAAGWGMVNAYRTPEVRRITVEIKGLPPSFDGFTIAQLSDLHVGLMRSGGWLAGIVAQTNGLSPDLIAITGDLIDVPRPTAYFRRQLQSVRDLHAPHGVFVITGNHEFFGDTDDWLSLFSELGLRSLRGERVVLRRIGLNLDLVGVDDPEAGEPEERLARALAGRDPGRSVVLLAHQPKLIDAAEKHGVSLMISGHTHGGQMWPFHHLTYLQQPYLAGLHRQGKTQLYVSEGTGFWGPPIRLFSRSEITLITLKRR